MILVGIHILLLFRTNDTAYCFLFSCCAILAPEEVSMASAAPTEGNMGGPDHCVRFDGCGVLHGSLPDSAHR